MFGSLESTCISTCSKLTVVPVQREPALKKYKSFYFLQRAF